VSYGLGPGKIQDVLKFIFKGGKISEENLELAMQYLNSEDIKTLIAFSAGGPLLNAGFNCWS
jgi:hypothetical protein